MLSAHASALMVLSDALTLPASIRLMVAMPTPEAVASSL